MSASSSNGRNHGIFGYLKGLFRRGDESTDTDTNGEDTSVLTETLPLVPPPVEVAFSPAASAPATPAAAPVTHTNTNLDTLGAGVTPGLAIPLQSVLNGLPPELRERVRVQTVGDATISIPLDKVLSQLSQGQVRIPFGDIRKAALHIFSPGVDFDRISVALPLNEILSRLNPALLVRRPVARQIEVPEDIASPFAGKGEGLSLSVGNAKPVPPAAPRKAAPVLTTPARGSISSVPKPTPPAATPLANIPAPFQFAPPKPAVAPAAPPPPPAALPPQPISFHSNGTPPPVRQAYVPPAAPVFVPQPVAPTAPPQPQTQPQPVATPQAVAAPSYQAVITTPLNTLTEAWPESLRLEILQTNLAEARIAMPVDLVETALKRGRVVFSWRTIRSWVSPAMPTSVSVHDAAELELPLKVIAPLFLNRKRAASGGQQRIAVDEAIPNLFFGFPQPEAPASAPAAPAAPVAPPAPIARLAPRVEQPIPFAPIPFPPSPAVAAAASASASAAANAAAPKPVDTNYYLWDEATDTQLVHIEALKQKGSSGTEFVKRYASPNEIVSRAASLDGVAGVLIALPDGLMVASRIPAELNGDTLAAFLPQIFAKVSACTKELRMGELNNVSFTVGNVPWKIFRVNAIFFAAFGHAAQPMPTAQLAGLAAELDRKNK
jgi:predicted regulator of Ras-like GTPase activity (Roadblock/LC7/MglB family)